MANVQIGISIINVPDDLSPLKFSSYIQAEAEDIQSKAQKDGYVLIKLYLPYRILSTLTQKKIDSLLEKIVNKHEKIQSIKLIVSERALNIEEMQQAVAEAKSDLELVDDDMKNSSKNSGYSSETLL